MAGEVLGITFSLAACAPVTAQSGPPHAQSEAASQRILFIGNSYTFGNDLPGLVEDWAEDAGVDLTTEMIAKGGALLEQHAADAQTLATIAELAAEQQRHPLDCMLDIGLADDLATEFTVGMFNAQEDAVARLLRHSQSTIGLGDAGAHLSFFCQAGTGLFLLQRYVRERKDLSLEEAVMRLTRQPAEALRIPGRGRLEPGAPADLVLFDPDTVGLGPRCTANDLPGGLERVHTPPEGVHGVWINGQQVVNERGEVRRDSPPGKVLRKFDA